MFLPLILFSPDTHKVNNLNLVQLCFATKSIVHSLSCYWMSENILSTEWNPGDHEATSLNQGKRENGVCFPLWI